MLQSQLFLRTKKEISKDVVAISHRLLLKGDFIEELSAGIYTFLPLGFLVLKNIENIIREEMEKIGGQEIFMPAMHPRWLWEKTGRWKTMDPPLFVFKDRHKREYTLAPTHEELITLLAQRRVFSFRDLPFSLFQIQEKFRNEMRATGGLLRQREFLMKDLYSFHADEKDAKRFYEKVKKAYFRIFRRCGVKAIMVEALSGPIGGSMSHEFMAESEVGEDKILVCRSCGFSANIEKTGERKKCEKCGGRLEEKRAIEIGHIFYLGDKYSKDFNLKFKDKTGKEKYVLMGCYGIGLPRLMATIVELHHDERGIIWPQEVAPFKFHLLSFGSSDPKIKKKIKKTAQKIYQEFKKKNIKILFDDREDVSPGEKLVDCDLLGIPFRIIVSEKTLQKNSVEIKRRDKKRPRLIKLNQLLKYALSS